MRTRTLHIPKNISPIQHFPLWAIRRESPLRIEWKKDGCRWPIHPIYLWFQLDTQGTERFKRFVPLLDPTHDLWMNGATEIDHKPRKKGDFKTRVSKYLVALVSQQRNIYNYLTTVYNIFQCIYSTHFLRIVPIIYSYALKTQSLVGQKNWPA